MVEVSKQEGVLDRRKRFEGRTKAVNRTTHDLVSRNTMHGAIRECLVLRCVVCVEAHNEGVTAIHGGTDHEDAPARPTEQHLLVLVVHAVSDEERHTTTRGTGPWGKARGLSSWPV